MNNNLRPINTIPNFKRFCMTIGELPTSYLETMTYYEMLVWFTEYMKNTIIPTINNNGLAVEELQNKYIELKSYVDNYFTNLDVQQEINNKLDQMVQDGTLQEIIASYLNSKAVFGFDNVESMKNSSNLINGSYAKTFGYYEKNDGGGALYKIREIINTDTVDNATLIAMNNNELVAELIVINNEINVKQIGAKSEQNFDNKNFINLALSKFNKVILSDGDFYTSNAITLKSNNILTGINAKLYSDSPFILNGENLENILIENIKFESTVDTSDTINMSETIIDSRGYTTLSSIIDISNSSNITIKNCLIKGSFTGIYIHGSNNVIVSECECLESSSKIICLSQSHYKLINNYIHNVKINGNDFYPCYLFQSTDSIDIDDQELSIISNNRFENNENWDAIMMHRYNKISINDNTIKNVRNGIDLTNTNTDKNNGNTIITGNYIEGTNTNRWGDTEGLNHGIIIIGDQYQSSIILSNNIIKNFGKFKSSSGGCGVVINTSSQLDISNNIIEMDTSLNTISAGLYLRGNINNLNVNNNIINSKALLPILLYNLSSNLCIIKDNILKSSSTGGVGVDTSNVVTLTKAFINNITDLNYELCVRNGDSINGISFTETYLYPLISQTLRSYATIQSFTVPANSRVQKFISKQDINYSGVFNTRSIYNVYPQGNIDPNIVITAQYGDSGNIRCEFFNLSSSEVTIDTKTYNVIIQ